jgi:hypothetical protein
MRDNCDRYEVKTVPTSLSGRKRLGRYLLEAGLVTPGQIDVALNDQKLTGMKFGEILAARGWVKQQTIEYLMRKIVLPEREALKPQPRQQIKTPPKQARPQPAAQSATAKSAKSAAQSDKNGTGQHPRVPISKPLPSIPSESGVNWVG